MNHGSAPVWATCPTCGGSGDEWHTVRWDLPPEPFPCPNCEGQGVLPVRPPKGRARSRALGEFDEDDVLDLSRGCILTHRGYTVFE